MRMTRANEIRRTELDIGESIAINVIAPKKTECWFCQEPVKEPNKKNDLAEDPDSIGKPENDLTNDSSKLGSALKFRPNWRIALPATEQGHIVTAAAHHLIPGNASLKQITKLTNYMVGGKKVADDVGYDVNAKDNGIWLPGSYGVTEKSQTQVKWSRYAYQDAYAVRAMKAANAQFHDSHPDYSEKVKKTLSTIADRIIAKHPEKCPACDRTLSDKTRPPYGLVGRLHAVSRHHRRFLRGPPRKWPTSSGYTTSKRSLLMT